jgi:excisionase family DNA binding protein
MAPAAPGRNDELVAEGFATVEEAADYLGQSRATVYKMTESGQLAYAKFSKSRRLPWKALRDYAARQMVSVAA